MSCIKEINERSPLRVLERSIHGGLAPGNLGVVCAGAGAGKTAFLVGVALDVLMRGCQVLHVALDQPVDRVRNYYDEIFAEMARAEHLEKPAETRLQIERYRRILTYQEHSFSLEAMERSVSFLRTHADLHPDLVVLDGYDWSAGSERDVAGLKSIAAAQNAVLWMSASIDRDLPVTHPRGFPEPIPRYESLADVIVRLKGADGTVHVSLLKDRDDPNPGGVALDLDPTTLLLVKRA